MKVVIKMISSMAKVTLFVLMEEAMKENGVEGNGAVLEDRCCVRLSREGMLHDDISGATTGCIDLSSMLVVGRTIRE